VQFGCGDLETALLQASLPVTTYYCTENKFAEMSSSLRQPEQIQKRLQPIKTGY